MLAVRARALAAGATVGTLPMIWATVISSGGLSLRPSHVFGMLTLGLVAVSGERSKLPMRSVVLASLVAGLVVLGVAANAAWFDSGFWPLSEVVRFGVNIAIGLAVAAVVADLDEVDARRFTIGACGGLFVALGVWGMALAASPIGLGGLLAAAGRGDTRAVLFDAHLPAIRSLQGAEVLLGARHGAIFGFITAAAFILVVRGMSDRRETGTGVTDEPDRVPDLLSFAASVASVAVVIVTVLSLSRSGILALVLGAVVWLAVKRHDLLWNAWVYVGGAALVAVGVTSLAGGLNERLFQDTDSLSSRQVNVSEVLESDWTVFGSPRLAADVDSPHNMVIELAAAGGIPTLVGAIVIVAVVGLGLITASRRSPAVTMLAIVVIVRLLSAARGSLDTAGVVALLSFVALDQLATASTSWSSDASASVGETASPTRPLSVSAHSV